MMSDERDDQPASVPAKGGARDPDAARRERFKTHRSVGVLMKQDGFSKRTNIFLDEMVFNGKGWREAAGIAKIPAQVARFMLTSPALHRAMATRSEQLRATENARNPLVAARIRDRALEDGATAAQQKVAIEAMKFLEARDETRPSVAVNVGPVVNVVGLSIDLSGPAAEPTKTGRSAADFLRSPPVTIDLDGEAADAKPTRRERE